MCVFVCVSFCPVSRGLCVARFCFLCLKLLFCCDCAPLASSCTFCSRRVLLPLRFFRYQFHFHDHHRLYCSFPFLIFRFVVVSTFLWILLSSDVRSHIYLHVRLLIDTCSCICISQSSFSFLFFALFISMSFQLHVQLQLDFPPGPNDRGKNFGESTRHHR